MDNKLSEFKEFVKNNPSLIKYVKNKTMSWQDFYELYVLYEDKEDVFSEYLKKENNEEITSKTSNNGGVRSFSDILNMAKNIDVDKVQNGITSLQKAISLFGDLIIKKDDNTENSYTPRPIYKSFED